MECMGRCCALQKRRDEVTEQANLDNTCINTIRFLAADAVQKAYSGHPGAPMGAAAMAYVLWDRYLKYSPANPEWPDRDRFVLSAGHASMLLYSLLHLTGYDMPMDELKNFRQWESRTPGHPEYWCAPGVETTTGPLGQGFANGVGMAIAERMLAEKFNRRDHEIINHYTYALVSDGDLQEGVSAEAASLAATLKLGKLIYLYDSNKIQIEGSTDTNFLEDVGARFEAYGWHVVGPIDGLDVEAVDAAICEARSENERPSIIICKTIIGYGSPQQGTAKVHGEPLGEEGVKAAKETLGWPQEPAFHVPEEARTHMRKAVARGKAAEQDWLELFDAYRKAYPGPGRQLELQLRGELPEGWDEGLKDLFPPGSSPIATRSASGKVLNAIAKRVEALAGGSADLAPSTKTLIEGGGDFAPDGSSGRNLHFGVREHAMGAIASGMALHGGLIPYTATFLVFSDYMRPPIRLAAMSGLHVIYVFTHDSVGVGEDGPTHQPIEQLMNLRAIPNLTVIRPSDATETAEAWRAALLNDKGPTALILTRQNLPVLARTGLGAADGLHRGGYVLWESAKGSPEVIIIGTGSEVHAALEAGRKLGAEGIKARVVSIPSWELLDKQAKEYRESVLPPGVRARVAVEAGVKLGWEHYAGLDGAVIGLERFGASAPGGLVFQKLGFTAENVVAKAKALMRKR